MTLLVLCCTAGFSRADDLPASIVARQPTLPRGMIALTLAAGYESAHVLGIRVRSATALGLVVQRGMTSRLELSLASSIALHPDPGWSRDGWVASAYHAWQGERVELAPTLMVPVSAHSGVDLTSTIALGLGLRWHITPCVLVTLGRRLLPLPIRPALAIDLGADAAIAVQLAPRVAVVGQALLGEVTLVGQTDRGVAPWHHLAAAVQIVYATEYALDVGLELHGDARDPRNELGAALSIIRRL